MTITTETETPAPACTAWCTNHSDNPGTDDGYCSTSPQPTPRPGADRLTIRAERYWSVVDWPADGGQQVYDRVAVDPAQVVLTIPITDLTVVSGGFRLVTRRREVELTPSEARQLAGQLAEHAGLAEQTDPAADVEEARARGRLGLAAELVLADAGAPVTPELRSQVVDLLEVLGGCIADDPIIDMVADVLVRRRHPRGAGRDGGRMVADRPCRFGCAGAAAAPGLDRPGPRQRGGRRVRGRVDGRGRGRRSAGSTNRKVDRRDARKR